MIFDVNFSYCIKVIYFLLEMPPMLAFRLIELKLKNKGLIWNETRLISIKMVKEEGVFVWFGVVQVN